ncbi:MAG: hemerythrin domain-containing protein [Burkholderiales bacterium]|jgi:hemerythrin-like domain-containing protein
MTQQVSRILDELRQDHRNLTVLLDMLDREVSRLQDSEDPDYDLLHDIMLYMTGYPDAVHHKKEDWVYARMASIRRNMQRDLSRIEHDHAEISNLGNKLLSDIKAIESGTVMRRFDVVEDARRYLTRQRHHMRWEDEKLFPMIDSLKAELDLSDVPSTVGTMADPVFGEHVESNFRNLFDAIRAEGSPP